MAEHTLLRISRVGDGEDYAFVARQYLRVDGAAQHGPAPFAWDERQRGDLASLFLRPGQEGPRERLSADLARLLRSLAWAPDEARLEDAERRGEELLFTVSPSSPELFVLPWETLRAAASGLYLADYRCALLRYSVPDLPPRSADELPPAPGLLFAWSDAGGGVSHPRFREPLQKACEEGGVPFRELASVTLDKLEAALEAGGVSALHLLCHGVPGAPGEPPSLALGDSARTDVSAVQLARVLRPYRDRLHLVALSACGSGDGGQDAMFLGSVGQELHRKGLRNVLASRAVLSVAGAERFVRVLYPAMLRDGDSLERAVIAAQKALLRPDSAGDLHGGDAYSAQLYTHADEKLPDGTVRPVLASYPFGRREQPSPRAAPPRRAVSLRHDGSTDVRRATETLRKIAEDPSLTARVSPGTLHVQTTVDGAQRLLTGWRSGALALALGLALRDVIGSFEGPPPTPVAPNARAASAPGPVAPTAATGGGLWLAGAGVAVVAAAGLWAITQRSPTPAVEALAPSVAPAPGAASPAAPPDPAPVRVAASTAPPPPPAQVPSPPNPAPQSAAAGSADAPAAPTPCTPQPVRVQVDGFEKVTARVIWQDEAGLSADAFSDCDHAENDHTFVCLTPPGLVTISADADGYQRASTQVDVDHCRSTQHFVRFTLRPGEPP